MEKILGGYFYRLIITIIATIPLWMITTAIRDAIVIWFKRRELINKAIISQGNWYEIQGYVGQCEYIGNNTVHFKDINGCSFHVPIGMFSTIIVKSIPQPHKRRKQ